MTSDRALHLFKHLQDSKKFQGLCCGWVPCFLVALPFRSRDEFSCCTKSLDLSYWSVSHEVTTFKRLITYIHILVCTDWLVLSDVYVSLFAQIGLFCPNKALTPVYEWICTLQFMFTLIYFTGLNILDYTVKVFFPIKYSIVVESYE